MDTLTAIADTIIVVFSLIVLIIVIEGTKGDK